VSAGLPRSQSRPDLVIGDQLEEQNTQTHQLAFSHVTLDGQEATTPPHWHHHRLPVVPRPRLPAAILPLLSPTATVTSSAAPFPVNSLLPVVPFCFTPSVEYRTAVPPSNLTLPPPPQRPFGFCHPAFWGALPYLIIRALCNGEQVPIPEDPMSGCQPRGPVDRRLHSPSPRQYESLSRSLDPQSSVRRRICDPASVSPDIGLPSLQEVSTSGLEDMAKMVSRLDSVQKMIL